jgi:two-component system response regulator YesN
MKNMFHLIINRIKNSLYANKILIDNNENKVALNESKSDPNEGKIDLKGLYKILIVDDFSGVRESIKIILEIKFKNLYVKEAVDGKHALSVLEQEQFDLMTTGIRMPSMDGIELLEKIRGKYPNMKRIVITAVHSEEVKQKAEELGAIEYILKPFTVNELLNVFEELRR